MRQQKNMLQTKEQDKNKEELGKIEIKILPNKEFKIMIIKMLNEKTGWTQTYRSLTELENIYKNQTAEEYNNWNKYPGRSQVD